MPVPPDNTKNNELFKPVADVLFTYLRSMLYDPVNASLDPDSLPEAFVDVAQGLEYLNYIISETRALAGELAAGNLNCTLPPPTNEIAAPLKELNSSLKHLTWQAQMVAKGNYDQRVDFMGDFSVAFNDMIMQLKQRAQESMDEKNRLRGFLAKMSHEIRTPMNAILGMVELALREEMSDTAREQNLTIKQAGTNLLSIVNDILDFSKIESGKLEIIPREYSLSTLINDTISIIKMRLIDSHLRFVVQVDSNLPSILYGDAVRIRQIILNLLTNSVKYTDDGYVAFLLTGEYVDKNKVKLVFVIEDSGRGITKENLVTLFDEFSQFDLDKNAITEGTGLGLAITNNLVNAMDGEIHVESEYGKGSTFTVTLPQIIASDNKLAHVNDPEKHNILIFERRGVCVNSIKHAMVEFNVKFKVVSAPSEFYREVESNQYTFVFLAAALYSSIKAKHGSLKTDAIIVLVAEFGEAVPVKNINVLTTPIFTIPLANILNGVSDNYTQTVNGTTGFGLTAPDTKILVVDDIITNLTIAKGLMKPYNMQVDECTSGNDALLALETKRYDLIFMDLMMPVMDGIETVAKIRAKATDDPYFSQVPIIAFTADAISGTKEMLAEKGFNDYISKPIDILELNAVLVKWIPHEKKAISETTKIEMPGQSVEIDGLDVDKGFMMTGGNADDYFHVLSVYLNDGFTKIEEIQASLENNDIGLFTTHVHALKSASASIGASAVSTAAKELESAGRRKDLKFIHDNVGVFTTELKGILKNIDEYLSSVAPKKKAGEVSVDINELTPMLSLLKIAFNDYDTPVINNIVKTLENYIHLPGHGEIIKEIMNCKLTGDYDEAVLMIDKVMVQIE